MNVPTTFLRRSSMVFGVESSLLKLSGNKKGWGDTAPSAHVVTSLLDVPKLTENCKFSGLHTR